METKKINLNPKKNGNKQITSFTVNISLKEALQLGFINEDKSVNDIEKLIEDDKLIIRKAPLN